MVITPQALRSRGSSYDSVAFWAAIYQNKVKAIENQSIDCLVYALSL
jgi:hypothetical protein